MNANAVQNDPLAAALSGLGTVRDAVLTKPVDVAISIAGSMPLLRESYRMVDLGADNGGGVALFTDCLADVGPEGNVLGIEFWAQSRQTGPHGPASYLLSMMMGVLQMALKSPQLPVILEQSLCMTLTLHPDLVGGDQREPRSPSWRDASGLITVLVGLAVPGVPAWTTSSTGNKPRIRLANVIVLRPSEAAYKLNEVKDWDALDLFCNKLLETPAALLNDLDRPAVF